ncbi:hypothetical protein Sjap_026200 [Stephania japonica]|uniref:Uncharacterized protein n=1 Tax=Stephania japonica TaxID=461633 RepID=A0AAP0E377_9MAGN
MGKSEEEPLGLYGSYCNQNQTSCGHCKNPRYNFATTSPICPSKDTTIYYTISGNRMLCDHHSERFDSSHDQFPVKKWSNSNDDFISSSLVFLSGLLFKAIGYHANALIRLFFFPIWLTYSSFALLVDPLRVVRWARSRSMESMLAMWSYFRGAAIQFMYERLNEQKSMAKLAMKILWGFFWAVYVYVLLLGILLSGFIIGAILMRYIAEEPIQMTESLTFDYGKSSPVAFVPIMSCTSVTCTGENCNQNLQIGSFSGCPYSSPRVLEILALPLVKVDYLTRSGKEISSTSYPCMLRFKSELLRSVETILNGIPLIAGYSTESQIIQIKTRGFKEGDEPTSCIKVSIKQRAEYGPAGITAGVPDIYSASLMLNSEPPFIKRRTSGMSPSLAWSLRAPVLESASVVVSSASLTSANSFSGYDLLDHKENTWSSDVPGLEFSYAVILEVLV